MYLKRLPLLLFLSSLVSAAAGAAGYVGSKVCAGCHKDIAATQFRTNMAGTWQSLATTQLPPNYLEKHAEGPAPDINYEVRRASGKPGYSVQMPGQPPLAYPVETIVGGTRHGVTFLFRIPDLEGSPLPRAPLVEGRFIHSTLYKGLALELGFPEEKPATYETGFGRVLTPNLEKRCFSCHVAPRTFGARVETGVACENCHGPGQAHLAAVGAHSKDLAILNPKKLPVAEQFRPCTQCHEGSGFVEDPFPENLLISDQVTALKNSECWRQTQGRITCVNCHNPHQDASHDVVVARSEKTCARCHSATVTSHAAICPVNRIDGCVGCHMKDRVQGAFILADHWIGIHPELKVKVPPPNPAGRTTVTPNHLYLRMIALDDREKAAAIREQLVSGQSSFFDLARANSTDHTSINGGFLGNLKTSELDPAWASAVLKLDPGEISDVVSANEKYLVFQRPPRTFRKEADIKFNNALNLLKQGKQQEFNAELIEALKIYPHFLRALTYLGISYAQTGNPETGANILRVATTLYPRDEGAHFNLGIAYGAAGKQDEEIAEYKRTLEIDPDYIPAFLNWGGALFAKGQYEEAAQLYRKGLYANPLSASLHYSLSLVLDQLNKKEEAAAEMTLAGKIDPKYAQR